MKHETQGMDPKVPIQGLTTLVIFLAGYFGVDLDPALAGAISIVVGAIAGIFGPAAKTQLVPHTKRNGEAGYSLVEVGIFLLLIVIALAVLVHFT